jgi:NAD(P)-dependent dehydrogenase (short-subunit alcohol dehydrogenase family)
MVSEGGHIVNTASMAGMVNPRQGFAPYPATKYAVVGISEGLAKEVKPLGIGVSILCPGFLRTNILESARNRPERYGSATQRETTNPLYAQFADRVRTGMDPAEVARQVLAAIHSDELYVNARGCPGTLSGDPGRVRQGSGSSGVKSPVCALAITK